MKVSRIGRMVGDFVQGFLYLFRGVGYLLGHTELWPYAVMPLVVNFFIVSALGVGAFFLFPELRSMLWTKPVEWYLLILWYCLNFLLVAVTVFLLFLAFIILSGIIAGPFNSKLARYTRESLTGRRLDPAGGIYVDVFVTLLNEVKKLVYFTAMQLLILPLNLIPVAGSVVYAVVGGYLTWMFLGYAFLEYPIEQEAWVISMRQRRQYLRSRRWAVLGFGCSASLLFLLPFVNIFLAPVAVTGASMLYEAYGGQEGLPFHPDAKKRVSYPPGKHQGAATTQA